MVAAAALPMANLHVYAGEGGAGAGGVPGIAEREIARRLARIQDAQKAMERGDELFAQGDHEGALAQYRAAKEIFDQLPNAPFIQDWRDLANLKFADCAVVVAREKAAKGDYVEARKLLAEALAAVPGHKKALIFVAQLDDPDRWPPALTAEHVENVGKVKQGLFVGASAVEIGDYDKALETYEDVLRIDPYNSAARRGMELAERKRGDYFKSAYDHQRSRMLNMVNEAWEHKPAVKGLQIENGTTGNKAPTVYLSQKMQKIIFPQVQFSGASIEEAVEFLRVKSRDLDVYETDPARKGVNIILKAGSDAPTASISLDLKDVPMTEALRYVTELAGMKFKVEPFAVLIVPVTETTTEQFTRIYKVPPDFGTMGGGGDAAPAAAAAPDPFAAGGGAAAPGVSGLITRQSALDILKGQGIPFPEGATAVFNKVTSQLIVKNTQPNLDLVESFVESIQDQVTKQVYITTKFVEVTQKNTDELGFDWLLGGLGGEVEVGGGTAGNFGGRVTYSGSVADLVTAGAVAPVTRGIRSGSRAIRGDSIDSLFTPVDATADTVAPGVLSVAGIFTDPQFGVVIRALAQKKGVDLMSAPSVTTKGGQQATVEVIREFIYPTEFDPPQIPTNVGGGNAGGGIAGGGATAIPVTPTTPTAFEMRPVGVRMEVDPVIGENGSIDLNLLPEVTEFDGFVNYGSPIYSVTPASFIGGVLQPASRVELTPNIINQPIFSTRKVKTSVTVWDGQTVALGGLIREDVQDVEDKIPVLGDVPIIGRLFRSEVEDHFKRNLMIFVTATLIDPAGQRIKQQVIVNPTETDASLLPPVGGN
ncbi:MAG: Amuc_1098 family type IV pilus outer membrane protein [Verrucomicrobiota bacterium]